MNDKLKDKLEFESLLGELSGALGRLLAARGVRDPVMLGVQTGGLVVAQHLHRAMNIQTPLSALNINFYRDDFSRIGLHPHVGASDIRVPPDDRHVVLVDDVLHTGRTVRAALNEIFDYGRPASVVLAVLIDRGGRELPVQPDACGARAPLEAGRNIKLCGDTLKIEIV